ncbi:hypothetical protein PG991_000345 [Apiospora marii]|uniref:Uncharacterized protein n=1 Tax=Apiospora marii TaxID=335849 RepID=A0ABR1T1U7_9PEZI
MAPSPSKFVPTAAEFVARPASIDDAVLDATIVTRTLPDVNNRTLVVGLLAVSDENTSPEKEGWHISDYLAIKSLVSGLAHPQAQVWLSRCDVEAAVKQNPSAYTHGSENRVVSGAASTVSNDSEQIETGDGPIPIVFEPDVEKIKVRFFNEIGKKSITAAELKSPLLVIICGRTTLEQDVYLHHYDTVITSEQTRDSMDTRTQVTVITPSLTSAGWQVNPFFNKDQASTIVKKPIEFLARQCGGIFSRTIADQFLGWESPFIDNDKFDASKKDLEAHPGPAMPDSEQMRVRSEFSNKIHALLASRFSPDHYDHSFSFDTEKDAWVHLIGNRKNNDMLETYRKTWDKLDTLPSASVDGMGRLSFLGTAFGGNRLSQISHLKHLVQESFPSWPGYYTSTFGQNIRAEFGKFLQKPNPTDLDCHVIFSIVEYRMTTMVLGDLLIKYAGLDLIWAQRCRDWDERRYDGMVQNGEVSHEEAAVAAKVMGTINRSFPYFYIPPGRVLDSSKLHHQPPPRIARYLAIGLTLRHRKLGPVLESALDRVLEMIKQLKDKQVQLLLNDTEIRKKGEAWWKSIESEVSEEVSLPEDEVAASFVPPPPELSTPNTGMRAAQDSQVDTTAGQTRANDSAQNILAAEIEVQSPEQPATPSGNDGLGHDRSPMFKVERSVSPEIPIESPDFKTGPPDTINIHQVNPALSSADDRLPPHLRKVWKPKSSRVVEAKPTIAKEDTAREKIEEEVSVKRFTIKARDVVDEAQHDTIKLDTGSPDLAHKESSQLEPAAVRKPNITEADKSPPPHLRGKGNTVTAPSYH